MLKLSLQSSDKEDIELFFQLLSKKIAINQTSFTSSNGEHHSLFEMNFKELQKCVTKKGKNVTLKQDLSVNSELTARIGLLRSNKLSFQKIADKLNEQGFRNSRGNKLNRMQVIRLYKEYQKESSSLLSKS